MKKKTIKYTKGDIGEIKILDDFIPPPHKLIKKADTVKVTLALSRNSVNFFKEHSTKLNVPYQRMIRALVDGYAEKHEGH